MGLIVGDVSGHGIGAALFMATARALLRAFTYKMADPAAVLSEVNLFLDRDMPEGSFMTLFFGVIDTKSGNIVANLLIWPYGDGAVVHHGTTKMIASIVQHGISPHETTGKAWMADFAKAWAEGAPRLGVSSPNHFGFSSDQVADADE